MHADPTGVRATALRGALRFWFRALAGWSLGNNTSKLAAIEQKVFGGLSNGGIRSRVRVRVLSSPTPTQDREPGWLRHRGIKYVLGQGLFKPGSRKRNRPDRLRENYLAPHTTGVIGIRIHPFDEGIADALACTMWTLARLGGLGARVRRGFGGIRFEPVGDGNGLDAMSESITSVADLADVLEVFTTALGLDHPRCDRRPDLATYPQLCAGTDGDRDPIDGRWRSSIIEDPDRGWSTWDDALDDASRRLQWFRTRRNPRQDRGPNVARYRRYVTVEYLDTIEAFLDDTSPTATQFPLAGFGLPITFNSSTRRANKEAAVSWAAMATLWDDRQPLRRASPLWIRPVQIDEGAWGCLYHAFRGQFAPPGAEVRLSQTKPESNRRLTLDVTDAMAQQTIDDFMRSL